MAHGEYAVKLAEMALAVGCGRKVSFCWVGVEAMGVEERVLERGVWRPTSSWSRSSGKVSVPQGRKLSLLSSSQYPPPRPQNSAWYLISAQQIVEE